MKLPTLTAIALATAVLAGPAIAADTPAGNAAGTASVTTNDNNNNNANTNPPANVTTVTPGTSTTGNNPVGTATAGNIPVGTATVNTGNNNNNNNNNNNLPHQLNPVLADNGLPRAGKIIGSDVYNMQDKKVGSVDDILMGVNGQPDQAVLSVKDKYVLVPFNQLVFGNTQVNGDNRVILPDQTAASLAGQPGFHYHDQNKS
jgi:hypothetical protein